MNSNTLRAFSLSVSIVFAASAAGCGDADRDAGTDWAGTIDTLENGAVLVSNPAEGAWTEDTRWRLEEEMRIGRMDGDGPEVFGSVMGLEVDNHGRLYVLDRHAKEVRVFDVDGRHVRSFGREGGGPGEFGDPTNLAGWLSDSELVISDPGNSRYAVWDTTGAELGTHVRPVPWIVVPDAAFVDRAGRLHDVSRAGSGRGVLRFDGDFSPVDTLPLDLPSVSAPMLDAMEGRVRMSVPFSVGVRRHLDRNGGLWFGTTSEYRVVHVDLESGDTLRIIEREHERLPVTRDDIDEAIENAEWFTNQGGRIRPSDFPDRKPAFQQIHFTDDEDRLWVLPYRQHGATGTAWDLFDSDGRYLGQFQTPLDIARTPAPVVRDGRMYAVVTDELDVPYVVRFRIVGRETTEMK